MNGPNRSEPPLPAWARIADGLALTLAVAVLVSGVFGAIRIGTLFSMSSPWRALVALLVVLGLRHGLVRTRPLHHRVRAWLRDARLRPGSTPRESAADARWAMLHIAGLWSLAVAQPVLDLVGRSPEFLVAHDMWPGGLLLLVAVVCLGGPAGCALAVRAAGLAGGPVWGRRVATVVVGGLAGVVALAALKSLGGSPGSFLVALAAAAGAGAAHAYRRFPPIRMFAAFLTPAVVVVPAMFLLNPGVGRLLVPAEDVGAIDGVTFGATPPVVVVVFDQFQLAALLDRDGDVDRANFPHFAALADDATWFRNATAVGEMTQYALPAILTGTYPSPDRLPVSADHPGNLFTLLGSRYRLHVEEPLSELCPESLCPAERALGAWLAGVVTDLVVVFLTVVLPDDLAFWLPPVDQNWNDFLANDTFQNRWRAARVDDRRQTVTRFIDSITGAGPTLHFMHVLLPHEPWLYLPTGQQFTALRQNVGLQGGRWVDDGWAAVVNHQRYLLQLGYVDTLLGRLVARLREVDVYDDALIVVTADHGASLRPGASFRQPTRPSFADVGAVPLFVKRPGQREGGVVDANVEVIDILPTLAAELGVELPWTADGADVLDPALEPRPAKVMFFGGARSRVEGPRDILAEVAESAARKFEWFATGDPFDTRAFHGRYGELIGRPAEALRAARPSDLRVVVDTFRLLQDVDPEAEFLPVHITGAVPDLPDDAPAPLLAVALNGVVAAITRPYAFPVLGRRAAWEAIVDPARLEPGANALEVFEILGGPAAGSFALAAAAGSGPGGAWPNLVLDAELRMLGAQASGFYGLEWAGERPFRWTGGDARLLTPLDSRPAAIAIDVLMTGPPKQLRIAVDGCTLFDETIRGRWDATFDLGDCPLSAPEVEIVLQSDTHVPGTRDTRTLGVAVSSIELREPVPAP